MSKDILPEFLNIYKELTPFKQAVLQILSINYLPITQEKRFTILKTARVRPGHQGALSFQDVKKAANHLAKLGLILNMRGKAAQCNTALTDEVMLIASKQPSFKTYIRAIHECYPLTYFVFSDYQFIIREIRIGLFTQDINHLRIYINRGLDYHGGKFDPYDTIGEICTKPGFQKEFFDKLHPDIMYLVFQQKVYNAIMYYTPLPDKLYVLLKKYGTTNKKGYAFIRGLYALYLIFRGNLKEAEDVTQSTFEISSLMAAKGCIEFLKGNNDAAIEIYDNALKQLQTTVRKRKYFFPQVLGLFYLLALIKTASPEKINLAKTYIQWMTKNEERTIVGACKTCIYAAIIAQNNLIDEAKDLLLNRRHLLNCDFFALFYELSAYWIDEELANTQAKDNKAHFEKAYEKGFYLSALIHGNILLKSQKNTSIQQKCEQLEKQTGIYDITGIIRRKEKWERTLDALVGVAQNKTNFSQIVETRLVWVVSLGEHFSVAPKEQKLNKKGKWSSGKKVSIYRLIDGLEYMTNHDYKVVQALIDTGSGGYYNYSYDVNTKKALLALVGHPLIFLEDAPNVAIELVRGEPELIVEQESNGYSLQFTENLKDAGIVITKESPTRYKIIEIKEEHVRISKFLGQEKILVPHHARDKLAKAISGASSLVTVHSSLESKDETIPKVEAHSNIYIHLLPVGHGFKLEIMVKPFAHAPPYFNPGVGGKHVFTEIEGKRVQTTRNLSLEEQNAEKIINSCPSLQQAGDTQWTWLFRDNEECLQVLSELYEIRDEVTVEWPEGEKLRIRSVASFGQFHMNIYRENDWFAASGELKLEDGQTIQMHKLLELMDQNPSGFIQLREGEFLTLSKQFRKRMDEINTYAEKNKKDVRFHPLASLALEDITGEMKQLNVDNSWKEHLERLKAVRERTPKVPSTLQADLRDYQVEGFQWLSRLSDWGVGACLSDDMGLGKTIQTLAVILERAKKGPTLVIAPASVCMNWISEANRFAPTLNVIFFGDEKEREKTVQQLGGFDMLISSYGLLQQEEELLSKKQWTTIVLDEGQAIKNYQTKRSKAAMSLHGEFKIITTGTPIENHLGELWNLFQFINSGLLGSLKKFKTKYLNPIERNNNHQVKNRLKKLIQPFILRRIKAQVMEELPPKTEIALSVDMSSEEAAFYEALRQKAVDRIDSVDLSKGDGHLKVLAEIMKLRRACCHPELVMPNNTLESSKLKLFDEVVQELMENNHKALVFSQFVDYLQIIRKFVESCNIPYQYLDGSTPIKERKRNVEAFQSGEGELFLISLKAGGLGLNLTAADYVIHMDPWWNPAVEDQASDRAHRIGQQHPVTIYRLITKDTIEEKIVNLHQQKRELADSLLEGSDVSGRVSAEELLRLIREQ